MSGERFTREMGLTYAEFFRSLPAAIARHPFRRDGARVVIDYGERSVVIELGAQRTRKIALLELPCVDVTFTFKAFSAQQRDAFMVRFDLYFRRGGG
ncbi:MAG: hypothetical protein GWN34_20085 [Gammaproteobacteria bacterium]|nr:hypothetical protein [Gammaproteobacteria bacterium]